MTRTAIFGMILIIVAVAARGRLLWSITEADPVRLLAGAAGVLTVLGIAAWYEDRRLGTTRIGARRWSFRPPWPRTPRR